MVKPYMHYASRARGDADTGLQTDSDTDRPPAAVFVAQRVARYLSLCADMEQAAPPQDSAASQMEALSRAFARNDESLRERTDEVERLRGTLAEYEELQSTLRTLPERVEHEVMVPLGKLALFPGQLRHTNEIMVLLGDNYFALRSASQAAAITERRAEALRPQIGAAGGGGSGSSSSCRSRLPFA